MSPSDIADDSRKSAEEALQYVSEFSRQGEYGACAGNLSMGFWMFAFAGLVEWRHELGDPRPSLQRASDVAVRASRILSEMGGRDRWQDLDFGAAAILQFLLFDYVEVNIGRELPDIDARWPLSETKRLLDTALVRSLESNDRSGVFDALLAKIESSKRMKLVHATYSNYAELMRRRADGESIADAVHAAEKLFRKRGRNAAFDSAIDGGGPDNDLVVDFRLGAILKWCRRRNPSLAVSESIHDWRW